MNPSELETKSSSVKFVDFLSMDTVTSAGFAHAVRRNNDRAWLMIHSDFRRHGNSFVGIDPFAPPEWYRKKRSAFYAHALSCGLPVINLEAANTLPQLPGIIESPIPGTIYTIQTRHEESPYPKESPALFTWGALPDLLRQAGVKTMTLGGCLLDWSRVLPDNWSVVRIGSDPEVPSQDALERLQSWASGLSATLGQEPEARGWIQTGRIPQSCVGVTGLDMLREGFDVVFSDVVASEGDSAITN